MKFTHKIGALLAIATAGLVTRSFAVNYQFDNGDGNNVWVDGINWNPNAPVGGPTAADNARVGTTAFPTETANLSGTDAGAGNNIRIGADTGTDGTVNVSNHATVQSANNFIVGDDGTGTLTIIDHGNATTNNELIVGNTAGSTGTVIMRNNSTFDFVGGGALVVGRDGTGTLEVHGNAVVGNLGNPGTFSVARFSGSVGTVLIDGGTINGGMNTDIGGTDAVVGGQGVLRIQNGGTLTTAADLNVWGPGSGGRSFLRIDSTATLTVGGTANFNGGGLQLDDGADFNVANPVNLNNIPGPDLNGMHALVTGGNTGTIDAQLQGNGHLVKEGNGTLILTNVNNTYGGGTNIDNGTLEVGTGSTAGDTVLGHGPVNLNGDINTILRTPEGMPLTYDVYNSFNANTGKLLVQVGGTASGVQSDEMFVFGPANLDSANSHLFVHRINNYNPNNGDVVTIIAAIGLNGQFSDAPPNAPAPNDFLGLIQPFADYGNIDPNSVDLVFGFAASFQSVAKTPNQIATAEALDALWPPGCIRSGNQLPGQRADQHPAPRLRSDCS